MKAAVISGGGGAGAHTCGVLARTNPDYSFISGTSTGALMAPLVLLREHDRLKEAYTSTSNKTIYDVNPFNKKGHISMWKLVMRQLFGYTTIGSSVPLKEQIKKFFTYDDYLKLKDVGKEFVANVTETRQFPSTIIPVSSVNVSYQTMVNAMWASANVPLFFSQLKHEDLEYADGGLLEVFSVKPAIVRGYKDIDVILHRKKDKVYDRGATKDVIHNLSRTLSILEKQSETQCILNAQSLARRHRAKLNISYLSDDMKGSFLNFNKDTMTTWYELGYNNNK